MDGELVIATELTVISEQPLLATLRLHTLEGNADFALNRDGLSGLRDSLTKLLAGSGKS